MKTCNNLVDKCQEIRDRRWTSEAVYGWIKILDGLLTVSLMQVMKHKKEQLAKANSSTTMSTRDLFEN
ncbi:hypothetical protein KFD70_21715 [Bacillus pfraonensis]|uniref:hypothetical protein n=1 Tax=Bacillus TaxID=1386 RepID=UPI002A5190E2|nr:hypothetical protein [Bacillus pseudomycoides]